MTDVKKIFENFDCKTETVSSSLHDKINHSFLKRATVACLVNLTSLELQGKNSNDRLAIHCQQLLPTHSYVTKALSPSPQKA